MNTDDETKLEYALRGKAWKVYWFLLKKGNPVSVREVQRALHFSSPSVAHHHLEQLCELGLVKKQEIGGHYVLVSEVKIGVLRHYVKLGKMLFSKILFLCSFFHCFLRGLSSLYNAGFSTREPLHHFVRSNCLRDILVRSVPHMVHEIVLTVGTKRSET